MENKNKPAPKPYGLKVSVKKIDSKIPIQDTLGISQSSVQKRKTSTSETYQLEKIKVSYLDGLRTLIESKKFYPMMSERLNERGEVHLFFVLNKNGKIQKVKVAKSSGYSRLDKAAVSIVEGLSYRPIPKELDKEQFNLSIPVHYE